MNVKVKADPRKGLITLLLVLFSSTLVPAQFDFINLKNRVQLNEKTGVPSSIYNVDSRIYNGTPEQIARQYLIENNNLFNMKNDLSDLELIEIKESPAGKHVAFKQVYKNIPVFRSTTVVSINKRNSISMVTSNYKPNVNVNISEIFNKISVLEIARSAIGSIKNKELYEPKIEKIIFENSENKYLLAWKIILFNNFPTGESLVIVDASTGDILEKRSLSMSYVQGEGTVFDPDPVTIHNDASLTDQNDSNYDELDTILVTVPLYQLNNASGGVYKVQGIYARSEDLSESGGAPVEESNPLNFTYNRSESGFEEVNIYYFINKMRTYIGTLGFSPTWDGSSAIPFDANVGNYRNAAYNSESEDLWFGKPVGYVDAGEDQSLIIHEYGHAIFDALTPGGIKSPAYDTEAIGEGIGDYLGVSYRRISSTPDSYFQPNEVYNWFYPGLRSISATVTYDDWLTEDKYDDGIIWASTLFDLEYNSATNPAAGTNLGRDIVTKLLLTSFGYVDEDASAIDRVNAFMQADRDVYDGAHLQEIAEVFYNRGFFSNHIKSGTISSNETWSDYIIVTDNVTVGNGVTLTIADDTFIYFYNGKKLFVNGTLDATGSHFTSYNSGNTWNGIQFYSGSSGDVDGCTIEKVYANGGSAISIGAAAPTIQNCTIENLSGTCNGISVWSAGNNKPYLYNNNIYSTLNGVYIYESWAYLRKNIISASESAVASFDYSRIDFGTSSPTSLGENTCEDSYNGIASAYYSNIYAGTSGSGRYNNTFTNNSNYNAMATLGSDIVAENNYWSPTPPTKIYADGTSSVDYSPYNGSLAKTFGDIDDFITVDEFDFNTYLKYALSLRIEKKYNIAFDTYKDILLQFNSEENVNKIMAEIGELYKESGNVNIKSYIESVSGNKSIYALSFPVILEVMASVYFFDEDYKKAETVNQLLIKEYPLTRHEKKGRLSLFSIYFNSGDFESAGNELKNIPKDFAEGEDVLFAKWLLESSAGLTINPGEGESVKENSSVAVEHKLFGNFPNPFNPTTRITFNIPQKSKVTLKVYDILGNEVMELVNNELEKGMHSVNFNASNLASGVYLYTLRAGKFVESKKMLLVK